MCQLLSNLVDCRCIINISNDPTSRTNVPVCFCFTCHSDCIAMLRIRVRTITCSYCCHCRQPLCFIILDKLFHFICFCLRIIALYLCVICIDLCNFTMIFTPCHYSLTTALNADVPVIVTVVNGSNKSSNDSPDLTTISNELIDTVKSESPSFTMAKPYMLVKYVLVVVVDPLNASFTIRPRSIKLFAP